MPAQKRSAPTPPSPQPPSDQSPDLVPDGSDEDKGGDDEVKEETANGEKESEEERVEGGEEEEAKEEKEDESKPKVTSPDPQVKREGLFLFSTFKCKFSPVISVSWISQFSSFCLSCIIDSDSEVNSDSNGTGEEDEYVPPVPSLNLFSLSVLACAVVRFFSRCVHVHYM
jgi:hypothetical protein